eukprot:1492726-Rhodomonas_salina.1
MEIAQYPMKCPVQTWVVSYAMPGMGIGQCTSTLTEGPTELCLRLLYHHRLPYTLSVSDTA